LANSNPAIFISISTGWAVRNFFHTGIIEKLKNHFRVVVFTTSIIKSNLTEQGYTQGIEVFDLDETIEPLSWRLFRQFKKKIYMESRRSKTEEIWEKYVARPFYQRLGGKMIKLVLNLIDPYLLFKGIEDVDLKINKSQHWSEVFSLYKPIMLFATHASSFFEDSLLKTAIVNNVPAVYMVLSWDHLSSKVVLSNRYHTFFVWNKVTQSEILQTYPVYKGNQIRIVGIPQYDIYQEKPEITYREWCQKHNLDAAKRTILFSTMPQQRHEQQHIIIQSILDAIINRTLPNNLQVLIKCHPFDNTDKYESLLGKYPVSIYRSNLPKGADQNNWVPSQAEMSISRDCLYFSDININIFSTVTLEAAFLNKPIIHIAFDPLPIKNRIPCEEYYKLDHFRKIVETNATILVHNYDELLSAIVKYLNNPEFKASERRNLVEKYFAVEYYPSSEKVANELINLKNSLVSKTK
jgi:CDP-glycerol glycerophosphotransferase (TagB/SpsB family)